MPVNGRRKGGAYEREVCHEIQAASGDKVERILGQARDGGGDIHWRDWLLECKRRKSLATLYAWFEQASKAWARTNKEFRAVVLRQDGSESLVVLTLDDFLLLAQRPEGEPARFIKEDWQGEPLTEELTA